MGCIEAHRVAGKFYSVERVCGRAKAANPIGRPISFGKGWLTPRLWSPFNYYPDDKLKGTEQERQNRDIASVHLSGNFYLIKNI